MNYSPNFTYVFDNFDRLLQGLSVTIQITIAANVIGIIFGFFLSLLTISKFRLLRWPAQLYIEFFRCTPVLLQVIWFFYCWPIIFNVYIEPVPMGILALGLNLTAFNAEAYRAGIQSIPKEQFDASTALSFNWYQKNLYVILPQAFRIALPVLITNGISILQQSSLVAIVSVADLMYAGKQLATDSYQPIETFSVVAMIYLVLALPIGQIANWLERHQEKTLHS